VHEAEEAVRRVDLAAEGGQSQALSSTPRGRLRCLVGIERGRIAGVAEDDRREA
jgi:hypothetical protein